MLPLNIKKILYFIVFCVIGINAFAQKSHITSIKKTESKDELFNFSPVYDIKNYDLNYTQGNISDSDEDDYYSEGSSCAYYLKYDENNPNNQPLFIASDYSYKGKEYCEYLLANHLGNSIFLKFKKRNFSNETIYENKDYIFNISAPKGIGKTKLKITSKKKNKSKILYVIESCAG